MSKINSSYAQELEQRLDGLIEWIVTNQPYNTNKLSTADFSDLRETFLTLSKSGAHHENQKGEIPEPSEGGPQYINDNPTPWP